MLGRILCICIKTGSSLEFIGRLASSTCRGSGKWENLWEILSQAKNGRNVRRDTQDCPQASTYMSTHVDVHIYTHIHSHTCMDICTWTLTHTHNTYNYPYKIVSKLSSFHCLPDVCTLYIVWSFPQACFCQLWSTSALPSGKNAKKMTNIDLLWLPASFGMEIFVFSVTFF